MARFVEIILCLLFQIETCRFSDFIEKIHGNSSDWRSRNIYYRPTIQKALSNTGKTEPAAGKFYSKYRNLRFNYDQLTKEDAANEDTESSDAEGNEIIQVDEKVAESIAWLKSHRDPEDEVFYHWKQSASTRRQQLL